MLKGKLQGKLLLLFIKVWMAKYTTKQEEIVKFYLTLWFPWPISFPLHTFSTVFKMNIYRNTYFFKVNTFHKFSCRF